MSRFPYLVLLAVVGIALLIVSAPAGAGKHDGYYLALDEIESSQEQLDGRVLRIKIRLALMLFQKTDMAKLESEVGRIRSAITEYLQTLKMEDLQGSAGMYRMRNELLRMINLLVGDTLVKDVLFNEMLAY